LCDGDEVEPARVFLQELGSNSVIIKWRGNSAGPLEATATSLCFGTSPQAMAANTETAAVVTEGGHSEARISGLSPDTLYYYSIGGAGVTDQKYQFRTLPRKGNLPSDGNVRIWVVGNSGTADANQSAVRDAYLNWAENNGGAHRRISDAG
jgi:hypothetical protein